MPENPSVHMGARRWHHENPMTPEEFDKANEKYVRETLGWEFDLLEADQRADAAMRVPAQEDKP